MNSIEESIETGMAMFFAALFAATCESFRSEIEPGLGKALGRKLTDDEWHYFLGECLKRVQIDRQHEQFSQWLQRLAGRKIIHNFVWNQ